MRKKDEGSKMQRVRWRERERKKKKEREREREWKRRWEKEAGCSRSEFHYTTKSSYLVRK